MSFACFSGICLPWFISFSYKDSMTDHFSGKTGNVREFYRCRGTVKDCRKKIREMLELSGIKILSGKIAPKLSK